MSVTTTMKSIQDIMRKDVGVDGDAQRIGQLVWMLFLKIFDAREEERELMDDNYQHVIPKMYRWSQWAAKPEGITGDELMSFINDQLFPGLKELNVNRGPMAYVVRDVFEDAYNYMKNGTLMRQVINKLEQGVDYHKQEDRHLLGDMYEKILKDLQAAGNAGEFYTPRAVTQFIVNRLDPKPGQSILDPACGTGGFLVNAIDHMRETYVKTPADRALMQQSIHGVEKKALPHLLCITNMLLHGLDEPLEIKHDNTLAKPITSYGISDKVDVVMTNPPFGGNEEDGIESNFPADVRTRETADLFLVLILRRLKEGGRAAVVLPDGLLFGDGVKNRIKEKLLKQCNLHTIVRLPNGVFNPYTGIKTNLLFFDKNGPTKEIWYYEHPYPPGYKSYSKTKPMRFEEFQAEIDWWDKREENQHAWKVDFAALKAEAENKAKPHWAESKSASDEAAVLDDQARTLQDVTKEKTGADKQAAKTQLAELKSRAEKLKALADSEKKTGNRIYEAIFNLDIKNPFQHEEIIENPDELMAQFQDITRQLEAAQTALKTELMACLENPS